MQQSGYDSDDDWDYTPKGGLSEEEFQENVEFFENHPLFMKQLPKDFEKNEDIAALQNLMYSEEPAKIAKHLNVNYYFVSKIYVCLATRRRNFKKRQSQVLLERGYEKIFRSP